MNENISNNKPKLIILCGIPGSGKSYYAKNVLNKDGKMDYHSSDAIRKEMFGDESIQGNPEDVFSTLIQRCLTSLERGKDVIYDATNISRKARHGIISACPDYVDIECDVVWTSIDEAIDADQRRERTVGKPVIERMLKSFQAPFYDEGIQTIKVWRNSKISVDEYFQKVVDDMQNTTHDNPHHTTFDVWEHCENACYAYRSKYDFDPVISGALQFHDCGKPYTKSFLNAKGETSDIAHFYGHQNVGAWMAYGITSNELPRFAWLISTHMDPYLNTKYWRNLPQYLKNQIDLIHEFDLESH